jgi:LAO/AO transport system kinase
VDNSRRCEPIAGLVEQALNGDRRSLARLISRVENGGPDSRSALSMIYPRTGRARLIGVTGAPGTGKSTLVGEVAKFSRKHRPDQRVGIVAVDPTSPFSGGAVLGDRVRMRDLSGDEGVFIRSMATRGSLGGLARATTDVVKVLDACGYALILIETVGAGQSEIDIARTADTVIVVEAPGLGDEVQALKAGILEIADVLCVNKADRDGAQSTINALRAMLDLGTSAKGTLHHDVLLSLTPQPPLLKSNGGFQERGSGSLPSPENCFSFSGEGPGVRLAAPDSGPRSEMRWRPPIVKTIATEGEGIDEVLAAVDQHQAYLQGQPEGQQRARLRAALELETVLREALLNRLLAEVGAERLNRTIDRIAAREIDPYSAAEQLQQDARCRMQDAGCRMQDAGCEMQDARCRMRDAGCKMQEAGCN